MDTQLAPAQGEYFTINYKGSLLSHLIANTDT